MRAEAVVFKVNAAVVTPNGSKNPKCSMTGPAFKNELGTENEKPADARSVAMHADDGCPGTVPGPPSCFEDAEPSPMKSRKDDCPLVKLMFEVIP